MSELNLVNEVTALWEEQEIKYYSTIIGSGVWTEKTNSQTKKKCLKPKCLKLLQPFTIQICTGICFVQTMALSKFKLDTSSSQQPSRQRFSKNTAIVSHSKKKYGIIFIITIWFSYCMIYQLLYDSYTIHANRAFCVTEWKIQNISRLLSKCKRRKNNERKTYVAQHQKRPPQPQMANSCIMFVDLETKMCTVSMTKRAWNGKEKRLPLILIRDKFMENRRKKSKRIVNKKLNFGLYLAITDNISTTMTWFNYI